MHDDAWRHDDAQKKTNKSKKGFFRTVTETYYSSQINCFLDALSLSQLFMGMDVEWRHSRHYFSN
jgi:hypothetical protein